MEFCHTSPLIMALSSSLIFSARWARSSICPYTLLPGTTQRATDKWNELTRCWNSTSIVTATTSRTTGLNSCPKWNLLTTMLRVPLWGFPHSLRTRLIIQTYRYPECEVTSVHARELAVDLDELHQELHTQIADAQRHYQGLADTRWTPALEFKVGARVYVKAKYFRTTRPS